MPVAKEESTLTKSLVRVETGLAPSPGLVPIPGFDAFRHASVAGDAENRVSTRCY